MVLQHKTCKFPFCNKRRTFANKRLHRFPLDQKTHEKWRKICNIDSYNCSKHYVICEDHFQKDDYENCLRPILKVGAIPQRMDVVALFHDHDYISNSNGNNKDKDYKLQVAMKDTNQVAQEIRCTSSQNLTNCVDVLSSEAHSKSNKFAILNTEVKWGFIGNVNGSDATLTLHEENMYRIYRDLAAKMSILQRLLEDEQNQIATICKMYNEGKFEVIENKLNEVSADFFKSQLRNCDKSSWTDENKTFALSIYSKSPRLYKFFQNFFLLPSPLTLRHLAQIPFDVCINPAILENLRNQIEKMNCASDKVCALIFDEIVLDDSTKQRYFGYEHFCSGDQSNKEANLAVVLMVRGLRRQWKQLIAYYLTTKTNLSLKLTYLIQEVIVHLQTIGLNVVATICEQTPINETALIHLCTKKNPDSGEDFIFNVNGKPIATIFDVPHLLTSTRNAMIKCNIEFEPNKQAKWCHILKTFQLDQNKVYKSLPKLRKEHFEMKDSRTKKQVQVAAAQLSYTMAATVETFSVFTDFLPADAIYTSEFVHLIDQLFDSLNGMKTIVPEEKPLHSVLMDNSPHWEFWQKMLIHMDGWAFFDMQTGAECTSKYGIVRGWQKTIRSIMYLWQQLKNTSEFHHFNMRSFNKDLVENLLVNKLLLPAAGDENWDSNERTPLDDLGCLFTYEPNNLIDLMNDIEEQSNDMPFDNN